MTSKSGAGHDANAIAKTISNNRLIARAIKS